jgi:membrane associated rhomboid family serine protease
MHLVVNMITLFSLGAAVVWRVGTRGFLLLYVAAMIGGAAGYGLLAETYRPMVGASGALFGLAGGLVAWEYVDRFTLQEALWPVLRAILLLIGLNVVLYWAMGGQLAWETHLGGFVMGWVAALLIDPRSHSDGAPKA